MTNLSPPLYRPGPAPTDPNNPVYFRNELAKLRTVIQQMYDRTPQVANQAPDRPQQGWIRFAVSPWDPLGTGSDVWVYFDGTVWKAL